MRFCGNTQMAPADTWEENLGSVYGLLTKQFSEQWGYKLFLETVVTPWQHVYFSIALLHFDR